MRSVALTGAGISVPSGIPDFRTPGKGLWEKVDPMEVAHIDAFHRDTKRFWSFYRPRFADLDDKQPNPAHLALAELEHRGLLEAVVTQNIDRLHSKAGIRARDRGPRLDRELELHDVRVEVRARERRRAVRRGRDRDLRLLHGQGEAGRRPLRRAAAGGGDGRGAALCAAADLLLCVGSSLEVYP